MAESDTKTIVHGGLPSVIEKQKHPSLPLLKHLIYGIYVYTVQNLVCRPLYFFREINNTINPTDSLPSIVKTYECRRHLPIRIFFPKDYDTRSPGALPLLFTIHGGGFVIGRPTDNDPWNSVFANKHSTLVVALNYGKAPQNPFPGPLVDLEAIITAVLADKQLGLHIDVSKVAVLGWSAGGNLALGISQFPAIREKLSAVISIYPVTDFCIPTVQKASTRQYKPSLTGVRSAKKDALLDMGPLIEWAYLRPGTDLRDPLLSPFFARREDLPRRVWIIGCELDLIGHDGWRMISRLAGRPVPRVDEQVGQKEPGTQGKLILADDDRFAWQERSQDRDYKWLLVPDVVHGFDMPSTESGLDKQTMEDAAIKTQGVVDMIANWLWQ
jgi:acetyl esterase/lipase